MSAVLELPAKHYSQEEVAQKIKDQEAAMCGGTITDIESYRSHDGSICVSCEVTNNGKPYRIFHRNEGSEFQTAEQFRRFKLSQYPLSTCVIQEN